MHDFSTNASLQLIPIVQDMHPYEWVDKAIDMIAGSGLKYTVGAFGTVVEGSYRQVSQLIEALNEHFYRQGCAEWILQVQWQIRAAAPVTIHEKIQKFENTQT